MADDWDLQAVVRGCSSSSSTTTTSSFSSSNNSTACFTTTPDFHSSPSSCFSPFFSLPDPIREKPIGGIEELHELYKPFFPKSHQLSSCLQSTNSTISSSPSSSSSFSSFVCASSINDQRVVERKPQLHQQTKQSNTTTPRSKKRKNQLKKVCQVPAESLSSDIWAWRKYGQKPIKGSPYPRGYYRCSSSKGCLARKQVERNRSDPAMFIVTYTAEHNHPAPTHRNSLAGSTRQKPYTSQTVTTVDSNMQTTTKPSSPTTSVEENQLVVPQTESKEGAESVLMDDEEEDEFGFSDMAVSDDFFVGLEGLAGPVTGDCYSDNFPATFSLPWVANNAAAAAGSI